MKLRLYTAVLLASLAWPAAPQVERTARIEQGLLPRLAILGRPLRVMKLSDRMAFHHTPGVSVAVINNGVIEWSRGYGVVEAGSDTPVTPHTLFQAASITKTVTALVAMRLVEQGKLRLDEDVNTRLVSWKVPENEFTKELKVTLRALLSHSAGMTVGGFPGYAAGEPLPTLLQTLDGIKPANRPPIRVDVRPGSIWRYSGGGYTVVQQLLEDVTGKPYMQLVTELALQPIGMTDSTCGQPLPAALRKVAASGHHRDGKTIEGKYMTYPELAMGCLWSTPTDLAKFAIEIQKAVKGQSKILTQSSAKEMLTLVKGSYGIGFELEGVGPALRFGHGGSTSGFKSQLVAYAATGQGAVVMTNGDSHELADEILRSIGHEYAWPEYPPLVKRVVKLEPGLLQAQLVGRYAFRPDYVISVTVEDGRMYFHDRSNAFPNFAPDPERRIELYSESASRCFGIDPEIEIEFVKDPDGTVTHAKIGLGKAKRLPEP